MISLNYKNKIWLKKKYSNEGLTLVEIANLCNISLTTIFYWMNKFQIARRKPWNEDMESIRSQRIKKQLSKSLSQAWKDSRLGNWQKNQPKTFKKCVVCGREFRISPSKIEQVKCCSMKCRKIWMSLIMKGKNKKNLPIKKCKNCEKEFRVKSFWNVKTNNFCSLNCRNEFIKGPNHHQWTGGSTLREILYHQKENLEWRKANFEKNNYTCQKCRARNGEGIAISLRAHHIRNWKDYPELRYEISNGITLCKECHRRFHKIYGFRYNNEEQLNEFLESNICIKQIQNSLVFNN